MRAQLADDASPAALGLLRKALEHMHDPELQYDKARARVCASVCVFSSECVYV